MYRIINKLFAGLLFSFLTIAQVFGQVKLPGLISDGMVLQRDKPIPIWGWAGQGEDIKVSFNGRTYHVTAGADSQWAVKLPEMKAGGPYVMDITGKNHLVIKDILIGDVWVCSGQSNMEFWMGRVKEKYADVIAHSDNQEIRQFMVERKYNFLSPQQDVRSSGWKNASPENLPDFTAVGYFFAKELYQKYRVPIGLIHASKGGSPAQAWLSEEGLKEFPDYYDQLTFLKDTGRVNEKIRMDRKNSREWSDQIKNNDKGLTDGKPWYERELSDADWADMLVPAYWDEKPGNALDGAVWYRKEVDVPLSMCQGEATLYLGNIADDDVTYVNGKKVGSTNSPYFPRVYHLAKGALVPGKNEIVVRIINYKGPGGFIKDKPYRLESGKQRISLEGNWKFKAGAFMPPSPEGTTFDYKPLGLYNAMIAPLLNYNIKGVIWYQGEGNTNRAIEYRKLFPAMIANWRKHWNIGDFPFLFVQLAGYLPTGVEPAKSQWAELREAQLMTLAVPNTGMAVAADIGEWNDVHPSNKEDVGKRLAFAAEKIAYNDNVVYSGPLYQSMIVGGNKASINFTCIGGGLSAKKGQELNGFVIAGADKKFVAAKARIVGNRVEVYSNEVINPVAVRYGWADSPKNINLYNKEGLPASPFRTDNFEP